MSKEGAISELISWARENGAFLSSSVAISYSADRGVYGYSTEDVVKTPSVPQIKIPTSLIISSKLSEAFFQNCNFKKALNINCSVKLLLSRIKYLGTETSVVNNDDLHSKFKPYVNLLPSGKETGSIFYWSADELELIRGTNLYGSLKEKLNHQIEEWYSAIESLDASYLNDSQVHEELKFFEKYQELSIQEIVEYAENRQHWLSFGGYLWSSIIFLSRAFPHYIIDSKVDVRRAMLLPLIDLLNHNNSTIVEWSHQTDGNAEYFALLNKEQYEQGDEVFNNYGPKGNEELLMGYGFVIEDNPNDSVALKIKVQPEVIAKAKELNVKIPTMDDYTSAAFVTNEHAALKMEVDSSGQEIVYFINRRVPLTEDLIAMFTIHDMVSHNETKVTLRSKLSSLSELRGAFEYNQSKIISKTLLNELGEGIDPTVRHNARVYVDGQRSLYKLAISELKKLEKSILREQKACFLSFKKVLIKDDAFRAICQELYGTTDYDVLNINGFIKRSAILWIVFQYFLANEDSYTAPQYLREEFKAKMLETKSPAAFDEEASYLREELGSKRDALKRFITPTNLMIASEVLASVSYSRLNSDAELVFVSPVFFDSI